MQIWFHSSPIVYISILEKEHVQLQHICLVYTTFAWGTDEEDDYDDEQNEKYM